MPISADDLQCFGGGLGTLVSRWKACWGIGGDGGWPSRVWREQLGVWWQNGLWEFKSSLECAFSLWMTAPGRKGFLFKGCGFIYITHFHRRVHSKGDGFFFFFQFPAFVFYHWPYACFRKSGPHFFKTVHQETAKFSSSYLVLALSRTHTQWTVNTD